VPLTLVTILGVSAIAMVRGDDISPTFFTALSSAVFIQVGYLCGSCVRFLQASSHTDQRMLSRSAPARTQKVA
jgi:hypothetical protein